MLKIISLLLLVSCVEKFRVNSGSVTSPPETVVDDFKLQVGEGSVFVLKNKKMKAWGINWYGELLNESYNPIGSTTGEMGDNIPFLNLGTGSDGIKHFGANEGYSCAVLGDDSLKCWGYHYVGIWAIGGLDDTIGDGSGEIGDWVPKIDLGTGRTVKKLSVGWYMGCAVLDNDQVKCWGINSQGGLGIGDNNHRVDEANEYGDNLPYVDFGTTLEIREIVHGDRTNCVVFVNGQAKCWGNGANGNLGTGNPNHLGDDPGEMGTSLPFIDLGTGRSIKTLGGAVVASSWCALLDNDRVKCWGRDYLGILGKGTNNAHLGDDPGEMGDNLPYLDFGTGRTVKKLSVGYTHACVILDNDLLKCWGDARILGLEHGNVIGNNPGEMGDNLPYVDLGTGRTVRDVMAGGWGTCAILDNNDLKCWGMGIVPGRLGDTVGQNAGDMGDNLLPIDIGSF